MDNQTRLRWGILGAARVNERLLPAIVGARNAELIAVASRREGAAAAIIAQYAPEQQSLTALADPEALLSRADIDAIYLPMANEEHTQWALKAIAQGKHVLIEKPLALTVADVDAIAAAAQRHKVTVMEGFMYRFHPQHEFVAELLGSGVIGEVRSVSTRYAFPMKAARHYRINRSIANGGGAMWDIGPYAIHSARMWFDHEPVAVTALAKLNEYGADVSLTGILDFAEGRFAQFAISFEHARRSEYEIIGTLGGIKCDTVWQHPDDAPVIRWWTDAGEHQQQTLAVANHFIEEIEHFSECVLTGKTPDLTLADARANCATIVAALQSFSEGETISITPL